MAQMHILFLTKKVPYPERDGEAIATGSFIRHLSASPHSLTVLSIATNKHNYSLQDIPIELQSQVDFRIVKINTDIRLYQVAVNLFSNFPYHIARFVNKKIENALLNVLNEKQFDIIQFEGLFLLPYLSVIRTHTNAKVVYRSHNIEGVIWKRMSLAIKNPLKRWYLALQADRLIEYELKLLKQVDAIIPISTADEKYYRKEVPQKVCECIPTGIESKEWTTSNINFKAIYFLGALDWLPNQQGLIWFIEKVFPIVKQSFSDVEMHIAGRNAPPHLMDTFAERAVFYGEIEDKEQFLEDKFLCIVPLFAGSGLKIKIIESLAAGKVIVTTSIGAEGMPLNLENYLYISDNADAMADNIIQILSSPETAIKKTMKGAELVRSGLMNRNLVNRLLEIYQLL